MNTVTRTATTVNTWAYKFGCEDARQGFAFAPETVFLSRNQQRDYALGFEAVKGISEATAQFTGSALPKPVSVTQAAKPRTESATWAHQVKAIESRQNRLEAMLAKTAAESPWAGEGNILWAI